MTTTYPPQYPHDFRNSRDDRDYSDYVPTKNPTIQERAQRDECCRQCGYPFEDCPVCGINPPTCNCDIQEA